MTLLSRPFPLRTSTELGGFRAAATLPIRYGYTGGELIQFNDSRTEFLWADHAVVAIDEVLVDGQAVGGWEWANATDATGRAVAIVRFAQPQDEGATLTARGRGKRRARDGELMQNPGDVIADVLATAGRVANLEVFARECEAAGIEVGGTIDRADSTQAIVRAICASIGAVYCADMRGLCRLWPEGRQDAARVTLRTGAASATTTAADLVNDLTIEFAFEAGDPRASVQLEAPDSIALYGRLRGDTMRAQWITSARVAVAVGRRLLRLRARPVWTVSAPAGRDIAVGDSITLSHPLLPATGTHVVLASERNLLEGARGAANITLRAPIGEPPVVRIVRQSAAFEPAQYSNVSIETVSTTRILTLREETGAPIVGAKVTLDGGIVAYTDAGGRVSFPASAMPPGNHTLLIQTADGRTLTTTVLIS